MMKLFLLLVFCLISCSIGADEALTTAVENAATTTESVDPKIGSEDVIAGEPDVRPDSENLDKENTIIEPVPSGDEDVPGEGITVTIEPLSQEESDSSTTELPPAAVTLQEQNGTTVLMPVSRSDDDTIVSAPDTTPLPNLAFPNINEFTPKPVSPIKLFRNTSWGEISLKTLNNLLRGENTLGIPDETSQAITKSYAARLVEAANRAFDGRQEEADEKFLQVLTALQRDLVEHMADGKSFNLTPKQGSIIKKFYDEKTQAMKNETQTESDMDVPGITVEDLLPENYVPQEKVLNETISGKEVNLSELPPEIIESMTKHAEEILKKTSQKLMEENQLNLERADDDDEPQPSNKSIDDMVLVGISVGFALILLLIGIGCCCYLRNRTRSKRTTFRV